MLSARFGCNNFERREVRFRWKYSDIQTDNRCTSEHLAWLTVEAEVPSKNTSLQKSIQNIGNTNIMCVKVSASFQI